MLSIPLRDAKAGPDAPESRDTARLSTSGVGVRSFGNPIDVPFFNSNFWFQSNM